MSADAVEYAAHAEPIRARGGGWLFRESPGGAAVRSAILLSAALAISAVLPMLLEEHAIGWTYVLLLLAMAAAGLGYQRVFGTAPAEVPDDAHADPEARSSRLLAALLVIAPAVLSVAYARAMVPGQAAARPTEGWILLIGYSVIAIPVVEEFYFRRLLYREFATLFGRTWLVVAANAVWFAAIHSPQNIPVALVLGVCTAMLRSMTGGIAFSIAAHAGTNLLLALSGY